MSEQMNSKNMSKNENLDKIICLFSPPFINNFNFQSTGRVKFFSSEKEQEVSQFLSEVMAEEKCEKVIFINYPHQERQFEQLQVELRKIEQKITNIIFLDFFNYDLVIQIQNEYLLCPKCQKMFSKEKVIKESIFFCPNDEQEFTLKKVDSFGESYLKKYFASSKDLMQKILTENKEVAIDQITVSKKEEIFSGEIREKLKEIINSL